MASISVYHKRLFVDARRASFFVYSISCCSRLVTIYTCTHKINHQGDRSLLTQLLKLTKKKNHTTKTDTVLLFSTHSDIGL